MLTLTSPAKPDAEPGGGCLSNANKLVRGGSRLNNQESLRF